MLKNEHDAEEVFQDCFLKVYHSFNSFRQEARFSTWFYRIVYNSALSFLSSKRRRDEKELLSLDEEFDLEASDDRFTRNPKMFLST